MTIQKRQERRLPIIYAMMRREQVRYGQQVATADKSLVLTQLGSHEVSELINARIKRRRIAPVLEVIAFAGSIAVIVSDYLLNRNSFSIISLIAVVTASVILLLSLGIGALEKKARTTTLNHKLDGEAKARFDTLNEALVAASKSQRIWSIHRREGTSDWKRNAGASQLIIRQRTNIQAHLPPFIKTDTKVISILYGQHTKIFFFPHALFIHHFGEYILADYSNWHVTAGRTRFIEDDLVPADAVQVDSTWRFVRVDGGPDRRFKNNQRVPIMEYCELGIEFPSGVTFTFQLSNIAGALHLAQTLSNYSHKTMIGVYRTNELPRKAQT